MASKEAFKEFVKNKPKLVSFVKKGDMTWQQFYEMYDLYGESGDVWKEYLDTNEEVAATAAVATTTSFADILAWFKNLNLDSIQEGVNSLQRVIGVVQDLGTSSKEEKEEYKPRPIYKHFED